MRASAPVCSWRHRQALKERDSLRAEDRGETGGESGPRSVNSELHTHPAGCCVDGCVVQLSEARGCMDEG